MKNVDLQPKFKRQRFLLSFIAQLPSGVSATDLQKLVFLHTKAGHSNCYDFIPYLYGAYSFQLAHDVEILRQNGFLLPDPSRIEAAARINENEIDIDEARGSELIRKAYRAYPYYAMNSKMIDSLFEGEEARRFHKIKELYARGEPILFTIGYEGRSIENFINELIVSDVRMLVDVRKNPISRKFGFSKSKLGHIAETVGIKYVHLPELGIESQDRTFLKTRDDYRLLFAEYEKSLNQREQPLNHLYSLFEAHSRIALVCFEKEPEMCHRHVVRDYLKRAYEMECVDL